MRTRKSSSGDSTMINPYMKPLVGTEVTTSKITRKEGQPVQIKIFKKIL